MERHKCFDTSAMDTIPYQDAFPLADTVLCVRIMGFLCARFLRLTKRYDNAKKVFVHIYALNDIKKRINLNSQNWTVFAY